MSKKHKKKMLMISDHKGNANQTTLRFHLTPVRIAIIKNTTNKNVGKDVGKKEPSYTAGRNSCSTNHSGKQYGGFLKN
jgi:hypothetical protein